MNGADALITLLSILKLNYRATLALGFAVTNQLGQIYLDLLNVYKFYSQCVSTAMASGGKHAGEVLVVRRQVSLFFSIFSLSFYLFLGHRSHLMLRFFCHCSLLFVAHCKTMGSEAACGLRRTMHRSRFASCVFSSTSSRRSSWRFRRSKSMNRGFLSKKS